MRNYFMYENKRRNKFVIEYPKLFATDRHCAEGSPCSKDSLWLSLLQGSSDFSLVSKVPQVKNRLFPTKHLPC